MLERPKLSFNKQREALSQAASTASVDSGFGQAMQSAQGLLSGFAKATQGGPIKTDNGVTAEALAALWDGRNSGLASGIENIQGQINNISDNPNMASAAKMGEGPAGSTEKYLIDGLQKRGFTPEQAQAFVLNFKDESGLQADITEGAPNVHGTRGQGIYQLTDTAEGVGRRSDYLKFVKERGYQNPWDYDSQLDFLRWEVDNTEKGAWNKIQQMQGVGNIASGIVEHFLRPAAEHRIARQKKYMTYGV